MMMLVRGLLPVGMQPNVRLPHWLSQGRDGIRVSRFANVPPALTTVIVLMLNRKAGLFQNRTNPRDAVVTVIF